jgi:membrane associated rhomboid family serine protease
MSVVFGAIGRNLWPVTLVIAVLALACAALGFYQAMAILGCVFGGMLMWQAERTEARSERPALLQGATGPAR